MAPGTILEGWHISVVKRDRLSCHLGTNIPVITGSQKEESHVYLIVKETLPAGCGSVVGQEGCPGVT